MQPLVRPSSVLFITCAIAFVGACDVAVEGAAPSSTDELEDVEVVRQQFNIDPSCSSCGNNAKWVLGNGVSEFDLTGRYANAEGFVYDRFVDSRGRTALLGVDKDKLVATRFSRSANGALRFHRLEGDDLIGGRILFHSAGAPSPQHALIIADRHDDLSYQVRPRSSLSSYSFVVVEDIANPWKNIKALCDHPGLDNQAVTWTGDRYTGPRFKVSSEDQPGGIVQPGGIPGNWFNIGCVGYAGSKLLLLRHSAASATAAYRPSLKQRQALLKSLVADVCGNGRSYTETGTPLYYEAKSGGWNVNCAKTPEAIWDENGMVCLEYFRRAPTALRWQAVGAAVSCSVPTCTDAQLRSWKRDGKVLTSVPSNPRCEMFPSPGTVISPNAIPQRLP